MSLPIADWTHKFWWDQFVYSKFSVICKSISVCTSFKLKLNTIAFSTALQCWTLNAKIVLVDYALNKVFILLNGDIRSLNFWYTASHNLFHACIHNIHSTAFAMFVINSHKKKTTLHREDVKPSIYCMATMSRLTYWCVCMFVCKQMLP